MFSVQPITADEIAWWQQGSIQPPPPEHEVYLPITIGNP